MLPAQVELGLDLHLDASVLAFTAAAALLSVLVFGLAPAIQASKTSLVSTLKGEGTGAVRGVRRWTMRNALVLGEIALSVVLLTASGLVVRSLLFSRSLPLGFDRQRQLIFFDLIPGVAGYDSKRSAVFFDQVQEKAAALPGVRHAALARRVLLSDSGGGLERRVSIPGVELPQGQLSIPVKFDAVDGNYFRTVGTRLIEGREFNSGDNPSTARAVIVSQTMAQRFWPGQEVLGRQIVADGTACQIVGVVEDAKVNRVHETPEPYMYFSFAQMPSEDGTLIVDATRGSQCACLGSHGALSDAAGILGRPDGCGLCGRARTARNLSRSHWTLWRHCLHGEPAQPRNRHSHGSRRRAQGCLADGARPGTDAGRDWNRNRPCGFVRGHAAALDHALWRPANRSAHLCRQRSSGRFGGSGGQLASRAPRRIH
jgi:hypothetical protein